MENRRWLLNAFPTYPTPTYFPNNPDARARTQRIGKRLGTWVQRNNYLCNHMVRTVPNLPCFLAEVGNTPRVCSANQVFDP